MSQTGVIRGFVNSNPVSHYISLAKDKKDKCIVAFNGAVSGRANKTPPFFSARTIASKLDVSLLSFSDPVVDSHQDLNLGWYLGNKKYAGLHTYIGNVIKDFVDTHQVRPVLFGGSGGGFAALIQSMYLSSLGIAHDVFVWNPQTNIFKYYKNAVDKYFECFGASPDDLQGRQRLLSEIGSPYQVSMDDIDSKYANIYYILNINDHFHAENHLLPFAKGQNIDFKSKGEKKYNGFTLIVDDFGVDHTPPSSDWMVEFLSERIMNPNSATKDFSKDENEMINVQYGFANNLLAIQVLDNNRNEHIRYCCEILIKNKRYSISNYQHSYYFKIPIESLNGVKIKIFVRNLMTEKRDIFVFRVDSSVRSGLGELIRSPLLATNESVTTSQGAALDNTNKSVVADVKQLQTTSPDFDGRASISHTLIDGYSEYIELNGNTHVKVTIALATPDAEIIKEAVLMAINFFDEHGATLNSEELPINKFHGNYHFLEVGSIDNPAQNQVVISIPSKKIKKIRIEIVNWKKGNQNYIVGNVEKEFVSLMEAQDESASPQDTFMSALRPNDKLIVLYTTAPYVGHETLELRPNRLTKEYISLGYKVIFFSFSKIPLGLECPKDYQGQLLQCFKEDILQILTRLNNIKLSQKIFICSSFPDIFAMAAIEKVKLEKGWKTVYEIRDDMEEFNRVGYSKWYSSQLETRVAKLVDKVVTVSPRLAQKIKIMSDLNGRKVKVIQNAAPNKLIEKSAYLRTSEFFDLKTNSYIIGYIGHLTPSWFDWVLLAGVAKKHPEWQFEIIGHGAPKNMSLPDNIVLLGPKNHDEFLTISERWKVGLIPFIKSPLTFGVDPNKIYEYLSAHLAVVTADMGSVKECPATFVYHNNDEFEIELTKAMSLQYNQQLLSEITRYVEKSRWSNRANSMLEFIEE